MDFSFSEEQEALREVARKILEDRATPDRVREVEDGDERIDRELWAELAKANLLRSHEVARVQPMIDLLDICAD